MGDYVEKRLAEVHHRLGAGVLIRSRVQTPEGIRVSVAWEHRAENAAPLPCEVLGETLDVALRKLLLLEDDLREFAALPEDER